MNVFVPDPRTDTELWRVLGDDFALPVYVRWGVIGAWNCAEIVPAVPLNSAQANALYARMMSTRFTKLSAGYAIHPTDLHIMAERCNGITPERHLVWNAKPGAAFEGLAPAKDEEDDFIENLVSHCQSDDDAATVRMVWITLCNMLPRWLLAGKPVRFAGLFTLRALPLRRNWRTILTARAPGLRKVYMTNRALDLLKAFFTSAGRWMRSPELMETTFRFGAAVLYRWNIFVVQGKDWDDAVDRHERDARSNLTGEDYLLRWSHIISKNEDAIHAMGINEAKEENAPSGRMVAGRGLGTPRLVRNFSVVLPHPHLPAVNGNGVSSIDDFACDPETIEFMEKAASRLLAMPHEGSQAMDVRNPG